MGKADTPVVKHPPGISLPLRQAGAALARAQARNALAGGSSRGAPASAPPRPSLRGRDSAQGAAHRSGTRPAATQAQGGAAENKFLAAVSGVSATGTASSALKPQGAGPGNAAKEEGEVRGAPSSRASRIPVGLPDFDVFEASIFDAEDDDDFEEAEDTVADVLTPGIVMRGTASRGDAVPHVALERPTAEHDLPKPSREQGLTPVPRVSLLTNTGSLEPAATLGPGELRLAVGAAIAEPVAADQASPLNRSLFDQLVYDVRSRKREIAVCFIISSLFAILLFFVGRPYLQSRGLIASVSEPTEARQVGEQQVAVVEEQSGSAQLSPEKTGIARSPGIAPVRAVQANSQRTGEVQALAVPVANPDSLAATRSPGLSPDQPVAAIPGTLAAEDTSPRGMPSAADTTQKAAKKLRRKSKRRAKASRRRSSSRRKRAARGAVSRRAQDRAGNGKSGKRVKRRKRQGPSRAQSAGLEEEMPF